MRYKRQAFTLAEVLITLTIIGVVAALTIPTLINNIGDQQNKIAWKKAFADLSQVTMKIATDNGGSLSGLNLSNSDYTNTYASYLNYIKKCSDGAGNCWASNMKWLDGSNSTNYGTSAYTSTLLLNNGTALGFHYETNTCNSISRCGWIIVDVNGPNQPNTTGKDIFWISIFSDSLVPWGSAKAGGEGVPIETKCNSSIAGSGWGCGAVYLYQ